MFIEATVNNIFSGFPIQVRGARGTMVARWNAGQKAERSILHHGK